MPVNLDSLRGLRALLVDDNATNLEIVGTLARGWGMEPTAFLRPDDGLAGFGNGAAFDLAIQDFNMPGTDGAELAAALWRVRPGLPMVLLSSSDGADAARRLFSARVNKPVQRMLLLDTLLTVMSRRVDTADPQQGMQVTLPSPLPAPAGPLSLLRVLGVEDNPINAIVVRTMLERLSCMSEHVQSGREAVAFTVKVMPEDRAACSGAGMNAFLPKPVRLQDLEQCLSAFTRSRYTE